MIRNSLSRSCEVDLIDLHPASAMMRMQAIADGRSVFASDPIAVDTFETYAYSDYARLQEERAPAIVAFDRRGTMTDDIVRNKALTIERCLNRAREEFSGDPGRLDHQAIEDAIVLNLQRACEAAIDLAMHVVARERLGVPQDSREAFTLLEKAGRLDAATADATRRMVGFRNVAVHDYQAIRRPILISILENNLDYFTALIKALL